MEYAIRLHLKTSGSDRKMLMDFCLNEKEQKLAIGWSKYFQADDKIETFQEYYDVVRKHEKRMPHVVNIFLNAEKNDLFWTRDLEGYYWICRATDKAQYHLDKNMDIGAVLPVDAYKVGLEVPGQIKSSFNRANGGTAQAIKDKTITEFSKYMYNQKSGKLTYTYEKCVGELLSNLPEFDLEELIISYLQIKENYYVLSNSIANKSTTIKIECELMSRDIHNPRKAVVQVKGGNDKVLDASDFKPYIDDGYIVYLFATKVLGVNKDKNVVVITKENLLEFYLEYKQALPPSITMWEDLFAL